MLTARTKFVLGSAWILFWLLMITSSVQEYLRGGGHALWQPVLWESSSALTATLLLLLQWRGSRHDDALLATPLRWFGHQARWLPVYWIVFVPVTFGLRQLVYNLAGMVYQHDAWPRLLLYEDTKITIFFGFFVMVRFGVLSYYALLEEKLNAERAGALLRQAQLLQLTQQMQPHFLFNALNTISALMHTDVARADAMLVRLADVLRATLQMSGQHQATLATELVLLRGYAHLMGERFAGRVNITWQIDDALLPCAVPAMSLQPLLENIFKHTVERRRGATNIVISAARAGAALVLRLEDDQGRLDPAPSSGIGLRNLRERLAALHGADAALELTQLSPAGVRAELRLPCAC